MRQNVSFSSQAIVLAGTLHLPESDPPYPAIVVVHPASGGERTDPFYEHLATRLPQHGIAVLTFDRRGAGESEGDFETANFEDLAGDVVAAVEYLQTREDIGRARIGLHWTSQGGWIAPIAAARKPDIALIIAVSASGVSPANQMDYGVKFHLAQAGYNEETIAEAIRLRALVNEYFRGNVPHAAVAAELQRFEREPWFELSYLYTSGDLPVEITQEKWHREMDYEPLAIWSEVRQPTLFLFAETDEWVPVEESMSRYRDATAHIHDLWQKQIPGTDHLMRDPLGRISEPYLETMMSWLVPRFVGREPS